MKKISITAYILLALALVAWGAVALFALQIGNSENDHAAAAAASQQNSDQAAAAQQIRALAADTAVQRAQLSDLVSVDVVSVANLIAAAGKAAHVDLTLGQAAPETVPDGSPVGAVGFVVDGQGTFSSLMRASQLLETLPVPSSVERLDLSEVPGDATTPTSWHLDLELRVLTSSSISS
jgi:hypothetical protein